MKTTTRFWVKYNTKARPGASGYRNTWALVHFGSLKKRDEALKKAVNFGTEKFPAFKVVGWLSKNFYEWNYESLSSEFYMPKL